MSAVRNYPMSGSYHYSCMAAQGKDTIVLRHAMMSVKVKVIPWHVYGGTDRRRSYSYPLFATSILE